MPTPQELTATALQGRYHCPAGSRYTPSSPDATIVICDKCGMRRILACIGLGAIDLCMHCVQTLLDEHDVVQEEVRVTQENARLLDRLPIPKFQPLHTGFLTAGDDGAALT